MKERTCDVLVIGGGGAALRAAIEAYETSSTRDVLLVTKGELGKSGCTALACSDRMAFHATLPYTEPGGDDAWKYHAVDIYKIGGRVSDGSLAEILAKNAGEAFKYLDDLGVPWARTAEGRADQFVTDGSKYARACYTGPYTANHIEEALFRKFQEIGIQYIDKCMVAELLRAENEGRVAGAVAVKEDAPDAEPFLIRAKTVLLATGGAGEAYRVTVFPPGMTGDGQAMAYRIGASLVNMEFIQIGICSVKTKLACSGSMMRAVPRIVNSDGDEFLRDYFGNGRDPMKIHEIVFSKGASWPVSSEEASSIIDIAVSREMMKGQKVYLDYSENPAGFEFGALPEAISERYRSEIKTGLGEEARLSSPLNRLREINPPSIEWLKERGIDLTAGDMVEVAPAVQHFQGGVKIREDGRTSVEGLYAAGEAAGGQHGANRPGGNALMDSQVFGKIAGHNAAAEANTLKKHAAIDVSQIEAWRDAVDRMVSGEKGLPAAQVREQVRAVMSECAAVIRAAQRLRQGLEELHSVRTKGVCVDGNGLPFALETLNICDVAEMVMTAASMRTESRGPHLFFEREDDTRPVKRDEEKWNRYIVIQRSETRMLAVPEEPTGLGSSLQ
jgi:succinate dehydrogenase/fumarate reductase flavoprotein subunit